MATAAMVVAESGRESEPRTTAMAIIERDGVLGGSRIPEVRVWRDASNGTRHQTRKRESGVENLSQSCRLLLTGRPQMGYKRGHIHRLPNVGKRQKTSLWLV
jgi:hypothetical protein